MKLLKMLLFLYAMFIMIMFSGCKTTEKQSDTTMSILQEYISDYRKHEAIKVYSIDSLLKNIRFQATITERVYHPPDSAGNQYLEKETTSVINGDSQTQNTRKESSENISDTKQKTKSDSKSDLNIKTKEKTDSQPIKIKLSWLFWLIAINAVVFVLHYYSTRKKKDILR